MVEQVDAAYSLGSLCRVVRIRQIGVGISKLSHQDAVQMSLFEDSDIEYYRDWDRKYDEEMAGNEDPKMLVYERKKDNQ